MSMESRDGRHRIYCLYATKSVDGASAPSAGPGQQITPGRFLAELGAAEPVDRMEDSFSDASAQMPSLIASLAPSSFELDPDQTTPGLPFDVSAPRLSVFRLPYGGLVVCLELWVVADVPGLVRLMRHTVWNWTSMRLDGLGLDTALRARHMLAPLFKNMTFADVHHLVVVDPAQISLLVQVETTDDPFGSNDERPPAGACTDLISMLITRNEHNIRPHQSDIRYPRATNRAADSLTAVGPFVAVTMRPPGELEGWLLWSSMILLASLARLRFIRADAYVVLASMEAEVQAERSVLPELPVVRQQLAELSARLGRLELELAFGVEAHLDVLFVLPSPMLAAHHRCAASLLSLQEGVRITSDLLSRASLAVSARRDVVRAAERAEDEVRIQRVTVAAGMLSVIAVLSGIFFGFFSASASPIADDQPSFFDPRYLVFYLVLLAVASSVALMFMFLSRKYRVRSETLELSSYGLSRQKRSRKSA